MSDYDNFSVAGRPLDSVPAQAKPTTAGLSSSSQGVLRRHRTRRAGKLVRRATSSSSDFLQLSDEQPWKRGVEPSPTPSPPPQSSSSPPPPPAVESIHDGLRSRKAQSKTMDALVRSTRGNVPANALQRKVMLMVYNEITAYPPEKWCEIVGRLINRDPGQVNVWFGNQRQREARERNPHDQFVKPPYVDCGSRRIRMRESAMRYFPGEQWSDGLLREIVMIEHFRHLLLRLRNG